MIKYYNRKWNAPFSKIEKYYVIMGYIFKYYSMRNIREYISQNEFYSKSYITHLFKEVGASSFKDSQFQKMVFVYTFGIQKEFFKRSKQKEYLQQTRFKSD